MGNGITTKKPIKTQNVLTVKPQHRQGYTVKNGLNDLFTTVREGGVVYSAKTAAKYSAGSAKLAEKAPFLAKNTGRIALGAGIAYGAYETYQAYEKGGTSAAIKKGTSVTGGIAMGYAGAKLGAMIGSPAGPIGAGIGAVIGGSVGYMVGENIIETFQWINE